MRGSPMLVEHSLLWLCSTTGGDGTEEGGLWDGYCKRKHLWGQVSPLEESPNPYKESTEERGTEQGEEILDRTGRKREREREREGARR